MSLIVIRFFQFSWLFYASIFFYASILSSPLVQQSIIVTALFFIDGCGLQYQF
jgi:hypothetical protein